MCWAQLTKRRSFLRPIVEVEHGEEGLLRNLDRFFFQAEDGIRDLTVTGVQTCALPISGVILFLFVVGHLLGNLKVFQGPEHFNAYAEGLRTVGAPFFGRGQLLWLARLVLLASVGLHIWAAIVVTRASWRARPVGYHRLDLVETTYAARTMRWGGVI